MTDSVIRAAATKFSLIAENVSRNLKIIVSYEASRSDSKSDTQKKKKNTTTKHKKRIDRSPQRPQESKAADVDGLKATESPS